MFIRCLRGFSVPRSKPYLAALLLLPAIALANIEQHLVQKLGGPYNAEPQVIEDVRLLLSDIIARSGLTNTDVSIHIVNNAERNAYSLGSAQQGAILINRGLLATLSDEQQLRAVIAHELAHVQRQDRGGHRRLIIERRADSLAAKWLGETGGLRSLLKTLQAAEAMDSTQRHLAARRQQLPPQPYAATRLSPAILRLQSQEQYYRRYQRALALSERGADISAEALSLSEALPTEAKFWLLLSKSLRSPAPCGYISVAADENPGWFLPWLLLGQCQHQQQQDASAALANSIALLPTNEARQLLNKQL